MKTDSAETLTMKRLGDLIEGIGYGMLTTPLEGGTLHSRPMHTETIQSDGTLLFFTRASSPKAQELARHPQVNVTYMGKGGDWIAIAGRARLLRDPAKMKELWKSLYKAWFPKGLAEQDLALLRITIDTADYWETPSSNPNRLVLEQLATNKSRKTGVREIVKVAVTPRGGLDTMDVPSGLSGLPDAVRGGNR